MTDRKREIKLNNMDNYNLFILDIETKPQENLVGLCESEIKPSKVLKDEIKIKADIESKKLSLKKKMSTDTDLADIICIGVKKLNEEPKLYTLKEMEAFFKEYPTFTFITFNGKSFDIPVLIKQGIKNDLDFPYSKLKEMSKKWSTHGHYDLMEMICDGAYKSLDLLLKIYLGVSKTPIDFDTATEDEIKEHNLEDLENTEMLYNKFKKLYDM